MFIFLSTRNRCSFQMIHQYDRFFSLIADPLYFLFFKLMFDWDATDYSNWLFYKDITKAIGKYRDSSYEQG